MYLEGSGISCGVLELTGVGKSPTKKAYERAMQDAFTYDKARFIIASVPEKWTKSCNFLKSLKFKRCGAGKNPNSGNDIVVFMKKLTNKDIEKFSVRSYCSCGSRRGYCTCRNQGLWR